METQAEAKRGVGRPRGATNEVTTLRIPGDLIAWGKAQPGGLSALVRQLLRERKERASE